MLVCLWAGLILASAPVVRYGTAYVKVTWGSAAFTYAVTFLTALATTSVLVVLWRRGSISHIRIAWLLVIAGVLVALTFALGTGTPEEAIHFLEYGILSLLIFRAFSHRIADASIYAAPVLAGAFFGVVDEAVQWLVPGRVFDLADIGLNVTALALFQLALATVVRPPLVFGRLDARSLQRLCCLAALVIAALGLCHQNTPDRIRAYSARVPGLEFIRHNGDAMIEYGNRYTMPGTGTFRSRFTIEALHQQGRERAQDAARAFRTFAGREDYLKFLEAHSVLSDPFFHEAAVHLYSRNVNLEWARAAVATDERTLRYTVASRENAILDAVFTEMLRAADAVWTPAVRREVEAGQDPRMAYDSLVSRNLITRYSRSQALWVSILAVAAVLLAGRLLGGQSGPPRKGRNAPLHLRSE